jgi:hypothetical protein
MSLLTKIKIRCIKFSRKHFVFEKNPEDVFEKIHSRNLWKSSETVSGPGSELKSTVELRKNLNELLNHYSIKSIVDCGCGDFNWMKEIDLSQRNYHGIDIVKNLIDRNKKQFSKPNIIFSEGNLLNDKIPKADLLLCRDVLVHLNLEQIKNALENIINSGSAYFLLTSFTGIENKNTFTGDWRPINLQAAPFNFPEPDEIIYDEAIVVEGKIRKQFCFWKRETILNR